MILRRYLNRELINAVAAVLVVLLLLFVSARFIKYIQLAVEGTISSGAVFQLLALQVPAVSGFLLPMAFFIGILLTLGRLYADHELAVLFSVGISESDLARLMLPAALVFALLSLTLSAWVNPWANRTVQQLMAQEAAQAQMGVFSPGRFQESPDGSGVVYVESKEGDQIRTLFAVRNSRQKGGRFEVQTAQSGQQWTDKKTGENFLVLKNGELFAFDEDKQAWRKTLYDQYFMRLSIPDAQTQDEDVSAKSSLELLQAPGQAEWAEINWRLSAPISILILCYMAVPLARTQPRKGRFSRVFPATMVYMVYALLMLNSRKMIESGELPVELGLWWIHGMAAIGSWWLYLSARPKRKKQVEEARA